jgi:ankyrin repeat protein
MVKRQSLYYRDKRRIATELELSHHLCCRSVSNHHAPNQHYNFRTTVLRSSGMSININAQLYRAVQHASVIRIETLLDATADIESRFRPDYRTPLHLACVSDAGSSNDVVRMLLDRQADLHATTKPYLETPLHLACCNGHSQVVDILLHRRADVHRCSLSHETPLHLACRLEGPSIALQLVDYGADIHVANVRI